MSDPELDFDALRLAHLDEVDPPIAALIEAELDRQRNQIELIASENFTWPSMLEAVGSVATNKYAEGYPGKRYYGGCETVDEMEELARTRAAGLFGAEHANVQPHAGSQANMAAYFALLGCLASPAAAAGEPPALQARALLVQIAAARGAGARRPGAPSCVVSPSAPSSLGPPLLRPAS